MTRERFSTQVELDLQDRVRAAVRGVSRATDTDYTLVQFVEDALMRHCLHVEAEYNAGEPFRRLDAPLKPGRRMLDVSWRQSRSDPFDA